MADETRPPLGLSIGATNLAAVTAGHAITRKPVLTLYPERPAEVGVPSENPRLGQTGLVITDFVGRFGEILAVDGSTHRGETLLADGLRALAYAATGGQPLPDSVAVTYPAHWEPPAVDTLGAALSRVPEWSRPARPLMLIPDAAAALFAVRANPGLPGRGTVAVCDFGGSGTNITLMDAAGDYQALGPTVRYHDFCGDLIDQTLVTTVMANPASTGSFSAIGSLSRLRARCRSAKEQLSSSTTATLASGPGGDLRLTRDQLDDAIRASLGDFVAVLAETLARNGIRDLVAVVSVGGGARIPGITTTLSRQFGVPVVTTPRPELTAAIGGALRMARGAGDAGDTAAAAAAPATAPVAATATAVAWPRPTSTATVRADPLAWSQTRDDSTEKMERKTARGHWRRLPAVVVTAAIAVLLVGVAAAIALRSTDNSATTPSPRLSTTPAAPPTNAGTAQPPPPAPEAPATTETPTVPPATAVYQVPRQAPVMPRAPASPRAPAIPALPIPGINEPIPGLDRINQIIQEIQGGAGLR